MYTYTWICMLDVMLITPLHTVFVHTYSGFHTFFGGNSRCTLSGTRGWWWVYFLLFFMYEMIMFRFMKLGVFDDDLIMLQVISDPISYLRVLINAQLNFTLYSVLRRACIHGVVPCCLQQRCCSAMRWRYVCLPFRDTHI